MNDLMKSDLTIAQIIHEARIFAELESLHNEPSLFGVNDGKTVGTYLELKFKNHLLEKYEVKLGNAASGIDLPELEVDIKVTSITQPQSSCPFKSARQKFSVWVTRFWFSFIVKRTTRKTERRILTFFTRFSLKKKERRIIK